MSTPHTEIRAGVAAPTPAEQRLAASRAALEELIAPAWSDEFPRSQTMRFLMGGKGRMAAIGLFTGLLLVKPKMAYGLLRFLPLGKLLPVIRLLQNLR